MSQGRVAQWFAVSVVLAFLAWLAFVGTLSSQELCLGAACATFAAMLSGFVLKEMGIPVRLYLADVIQMWRIPGHLVTGVWEILAVLFKDLTGIAKAESLFRVAPFERLSGGRGLIRRALAVGFTTAAPNFIVVGIDEPKGLILFHQIQRSAVPKMTQKLGAKG
ncbi:MAG TPA: hypothetical protein VGG26_02755 [Terracidiphilus sp.]|jgi:hypothetical protein